MYVCVNRSPDNNELLPVTSHPVGDATIPQAALNDLSVSIPTSTPPRSAVSGSVSGDASMAEAVANGHVSNMTLNIRVPSRMTRDEVENAPRRQANDLQHQQQQQQPQNHDGELNSKLSYCSRTIASTDITRSTATNDNLPVNVQHHHQNYQRRQQDRQQSLPPPNSSRTISSIENTRVTGDHLLHHKDRHHHHQQTQLQLQLQQQHERKKKFPNLNLQPLNSSNAVTIAEQTRLADDQVLHPLEHHRHHHHHHQQQQQQQQERQRNATSKIYNSLTTTTSTDLTHVTGDTAPRSQVQTTRRPPAPPSTSFFRHTPTETIPLLRTPTAGDRPPVSEVERKSGRPGQTAPDSSFDVSTLPRAKFQTARATNGKVCQGQTVLSQVTTAALPTRTSSYLPISSLTNRSNSHNPAAPASKNVSFLRERVQFFTRNELAAAVAMNKSSGTSSNSNQTTTPSKTNWFRRVLFK